MSTFTVPAVRVTVEDHPNADRLDIVRPDGMDYVAVSQKGLYKTGDAAIYVPEGGVVPEPILKAAGFFDEEQGKGLLAGPKGDRVKAIKLRGQLSQGIFLHPDKVFNPPGELEIGRDYAPLFQIAKYQPPIPTEMAGQLEPSAVIRSYTDIENIKRYPDVLHHGEPVVMTEKIHGTCAIFVRTEEQFLVSSKGLSSKGLVIVESDNNVYWRAARKYNLSEKLRFLREYHMVPAVFLFGEVYGPVQDLKYGGELDFRAFDVALADSFAIKYLDYDDLKIQVGRWEEIPLVPELYSGPFSEDALAEYTDGKEQVTGEQKHLREGVVIRPLFERTDPELGRVILKSVSSDYLVRKGATTEYE